MEFKRAEVVSNITGEVLHTFTEMEMFLGKQYMTAMCVGRFYTIDEVELKYETLTFYVH